MNPDTNYQESLNLPKPQPEKLGVSNADKNEASASSHESTSPQPPVTSTHQDASAPVAGPPAPSPTIQAIPPSQKTALSDDDLAADDADLIEKEWVTRAKMIVDRTKDDPHTQNRHINLVKADYIKKRYNKDIKVSED